jgi:Leucine-rich repeat (LRR) protein
MLDLYDNEMTGVMTPVLSLHALRELYLSYNYFTGQLPLQLSNLSGIQKLYLNDNLFSGTLVTTLGNLTGVEFLDLNFNMLSGTLIDEFAQLSSLQRLYLNDNSLTGTLSASWSRLTQLERLDLFNCKLSGPLIHELSEMIMLSKLYLNGNMFSGSIPPYLGQFTLLENLDLFDNQLTGTIPEELRTLSMLARIRLEKNQLHGPLPSFLGQFTDLTLLSLAQNYFTGPLIDMSLVGKLKRLMLQNNRLTGAVGKTHFHPNASLEVLDLSDNRFTGSVPAFIFRFPRLITLALSLNCFRGELPVEMCEARTLLILAMDGLGAAMQCRDKYTIPFSGVVLGNTIDGSIPSCLWSLPLIELVHLSGNGLTGSISNNFPMNSTLVDLSLGNIMIKKILSSRHSFLIHYVLCMFCCIYSSIQLIIE